VFHFYSPCCFVVAAHSQIERMYRVPKKKNLPKRDMELRDQTEEEENVRRRLSSTQSVCNNNLNVTKDDVDTARKMFLGGLPLLPWLWICAALFFREKWSRGKSSTNHDQLCVYYNRYLVGSSIYAVLLVIWVIIFQSSYETLNMKSLLVNALASTDGWGED
jgi:hypothetical protein